MRSLKGMQLGNSVMSSCASHIEKGLVYDPGCCGFPSRGMMWWSRRLWLLLTAVFLLRDTEGLGVWNEKPAPYWYGAAASLDQPQKVNYLTKMAGSASSDAPMQSSSVLPHQGPELSQTGAVQSSCGSSSQMDSSKAGAASGSAGLYQSVFQSSQQRPGDVSQPQLLGSSGHDAQFWGQSSKSVLSTSQVSSSLFPHDVKHRGSSDNLDSGFGAQGFPSQDAASRVHTVQSAPVLQGGYQVPSLGQSKYLPSEKPQPYVSPLHPQSYPQVPHPSQTQTVGGLASTAQQSGYGGRYPSSSWSVSQPGVTLQVPSLASQSTSGSSGVSSTNLQSVRDAVPQSSGSSYWALSSHAAGGWQTSSERSALQSGQSRTQGSSVTWTAPTSLQSSSGAPQKSSGYYGPLPVQGAGTGQTTSWQSALQSKIQGVGSGVTSASDAQKSSRYFGDVPAQGAGTWQLSSPNQPSVQTAQTQMQGSAVGSGFTSASQHSSSEVQQKSNYYGQLHSQGAGTWQPSSPNQPSVQTAQTQMQASSASNGLTSTSQQSGMDTPHTSSYYGPLPVKGIGKGQNTGWQSALQSQMQGVGSGVTSTSLSASDAQKSSRYFGVVPAQGEVTWQPSSPNQRSVQASSASSGMDVPQTSSSSYGVHPSQVVSTWQTSNLQSPLHTALSQKQSSSAITGLTSTSQQPGMDTPHTSSYYGPLPVKGIGKGQTTGWQSALQSQMQGVGSGVTSTSLSASDVPQSTSSSYRVVPSQAVSAWQTSNFQPSLQTAQTQKQGTQNAVTQAGVNQPASDVAFGVDCVKGLLQSTSSGSLGSTSYSFAQDMPVHSYGHQSKPQSSPTHFSWMAKRKGSV